MKKLLPCPFCGCDRGVVVEGGKDDVNDMRQFPFVRCLMCDAEGPGERTVEGAIENWNVRK